MIFLSFTDVEPAEHDAGTEHFHYHHPVVLHSRNVVADYAVASVTPVLEASRAYGGERALPYRPFIGERAVHVAGDVHNLRVL